MQKSDLAIPVPCTVDWQKMTPADKGRFCGDCKKVVRDLSKMSEVEARELVTSARSGELCVRYLYDRHGKIFFAGDHRANGLLPQSLLNRAKRTALAAATLAVPVMLQACSASPLDAFSSHENDPSLTPLMGGAPELEPQVDAASPIRADAGADAADPDAADPDTNDAAPPIDVTDAAPDGGVT